MPVIKWYLNLDRNYGTTNKERAGLSIDLVAKRDLGHGLRAVGGREVNWVLAEAGSYDSDRDYVNPNQSRLDAARSAEHNGEFRNCLNITTLGGRTFTVTATKATGANNVSFNKQYQSWRRIYYTVHFMNSHCKDLFESVEAQIKAIFENVFIELKPRGTRSCILNEATTDSNGPGGNALTLTYNSADPSLDRTPHHLRVVIARDVVTSLPLEAHWTMDSNTNTPANKLIRIGSEGINHREVLYSNDIAIITAVNPAQDLTVSIHDAEVAVPNACIARNGAHGFRVDLGADALTLPIRAALSGGLRANFTATLTGRRCKAKYAAGNDHVVQATLSLANVETNAVTVGSAKVWVAGLGASVFVEDPQILLADPGAADQLRVTLPNVGAIDVAAARITRESEHKLKFDLSAEAQILAHIAQAHNQIQISVRRHGLLGNGPIEAEAAHEFDLREFKKNTVNKVRREVTIQVDNPGHHIDVRADWLAPAANNPLTMRIESLGAPIDVPAIAVLFQTTHTIKIDLNADATLHPAAAAMAAGRKLTFDGKIKGLHSMGGYSPKNNRKFIALTARKLSDDETDATTAKRLKYAFCHELGHALGLGYDSVQNYRLAGPEPNNLHYKDPQGGKGDHCSYNARLEPSGADRGRESTTSGDVFVATGAGPLCIMYHAIDLTHVGDFCPTCKAHLRRTRVRL